MTDPLSPENLARLEELAKERAVCSRAVVIDTDFIIAAQEVIPLLIARVKEQVKQIAVQDVLLDSQYRAGAKAGWNCAQDDNAEAKFQKLMEYDGYLKPIKDAKLSSGVDPRAATISRLRALLERCRDHARDIIYGDDELYAAIDAELNPSPEGQPK